VPDGKDPNRKEANREFTDGAAAHTVVSLSQALLAPLDAILKAQVHAARSFLNFVLQIGYPHQPVGGKLPAPGPGTPSGGATPSVAGSGPARRPEDGQAYTMDFFHDLPGGGRQKVSVPALALVPIAPLGVSGADFTFDFYIRELARHPQIQASEKQMTDLEKSQSPSAGEEVDRFTRPWFLVDTPVSVKGTFAPSSATGDGGERVQTEEARVSIQVKVTTMPVPAALEKLLAGLTQVSNVEYTPPPPAPQPQPS
jgi:hypothetical protein